MEIIPSLAAILAHHVLNEHIHFSIKYLSSYSYFAWQSECIDTEDEVLFPTEFLLKSFLTI